MSYLYNVYSSPKKGQWGFTAVQDGAVRTAFVDGRDQQGVVGLGLIGVAPREHTQGVVHAFGATHVSGDHRGAAGAGVPLGEQLADHPGVVDQRGRVHRVQRDGALHVPELADVELPALHRGPAQERVADGLQRLLVFDDALPLVSVPGRFAVHVARQHRAPGLLELQEDDVLGRGPFQQGDVRAQPDAAERIMSSPRARIARNFSINKVEN